ncbi:MAG: dihydroorotase [Bacteroidales bacterium]|jgi:dihydroorotase|nr:dihydroorotase [Bacteroidales bacterium]
MLIKNIRIVDDSQDFTGDIRVEDGLISEIGTNLDGDSICLDYSRQEVFLLPAFTDLHIHFRDPGFTYKEDVKTGSEAARKGGYTAVNLMPNTNPVADNMEIVKDVERRVAEVGLIFANQTLSMTKGLQGQNFDHLNELKKNEILFITDDGKGVNDDATMEEIFKICKEKNITIMAHEEDSRYSATDMRKAENLMTFRDIVLSEKYNSPIHFCHVSTIEAIEAIEKAKVQGVPVSCEVTPHHLTATSDETNHYRVNPPFRKQADVDALIRAIQNGVVDAIATDHAPHSAEDKLNGAPGMTGLEIAFPLCYTALVKSGHINLQTLVKLMSTQPSNMMKLNKGKIQPGYAADFVIVELDTPFTINSNTFISKGKNTPFSGKEVCGRVLQTFRAGDVYPQN